MAATLAAMETDADGLIFVNLVDFDQQFGHRNDIAGYGAALEQFDSLGSAIRRAPCVRASTSPIFTADHGCDPTVPGTDHTREYVPLLVEGPAAHRGVDLGLRASLSDIGQTVAENFGAKIAQGKSFLPQIL